MDDINSSVDRDTLFKELNAVKNRVNELEKKMSALMDIVKTDVEINELATERALTDIEIDIAELQGKIEDKTDE